MSRHHRRCLWLWSQKNSTHPYLQFTAMESPHDHWLHLTVKMLHLPEWQVKDYFSVDKETEDEESKNVLSTSISNILQLNFQKLLFFLPTPCSTGKWLLIFFHELFDMLGKKKSKQETLACLGDRENMSLLLGWKAKGKTEGNLWFLREIEQCGRKFTHYTDERIAQEEESDFNLTTFVLAQEMSHHIPYSSNVLNLFDSIKL